jgi:hypothetical protein
MLNREIELNVQQQQRQQAREHYADLHRMAGETLALIQGGICPPALDPFFDRATEESYCRTLFPSPYKDWCPITVGELRAVVTQLKAALRGCSGQPREDGPTLTDAQRELMEQNERLNRNREQMRRIQERMNQNR